MNSFCGAIFFSEIFQVFFQILVCKTNVEEFSNTVTGRVQVEQET